ncbi:MAG: DUF4270 family protein [Hymenobacteraceae bacterium]|nr:DUF4270 family protein [Hymenobacteraceae bacterium]
MLFCNNIDAARPVRRQRAALLISAAFLFLATTSCDPANEVGQDVLPDEVPSTATYVELPVSGATVLRVDSVLTANKVTALVGNLLDVNVGTTNAEAYFQVSPLTPNPTVRLTDPTVKAKVDSLVLTLTFSQYYGSVNGIQNLEAYKLTEVFADDKAYYAGSAPLTTDAKKLGETSFRLRYATSTSTGRVLKYPWIVGDTATRKADGVRTLQALRMLMDTTLRNDLFNAVGTPALASLDAIQGLLKGLVVRPAGTGTLVTLSPQTTGTKLELFYHLPKDSTVAQKKSHSFIFSLGNPNTERYFSRITTDYAKGEYLKVFAARQPTADGDTVAAGTANGFTAYLQGGLELATRLKITGFGALQAKQGRLLINRAELVIPVKPYAVGVYPVPPAAYLVEVDARNRFLKANDQWRTVQANSADPQGTANPAIVTYDATQRAYRVLLTSYLDARLHDKLLDTKATAMWLVPTLPSATGFSLNRALIDAAPGQIKLKVYYSDLN